MINVSIGPGCCNENIVHLRLPGSCGTGRIPLAKKNMKNIRPCRGLFCVFSQVGLGDNRTFLHDWFESPPELRWPLDLDWVDWACWTYGIKHGKNGFVWTVRLDIFLKVHGRLERVFWKSSWNLKKLCLDMFRLLIMSQLTSQPTS